MVLWVRQGAVRVTDHRLSRFGRIREAAEARHGQQHSPKRTAVMGVDGAQLQSQHVRED